MTRMTNSLKESIISSILDDIPYIDYEPLLKKEAERIAYEAMPTEIKMIYDNPELRCYLLNQACHIRNSYTSVYIVAANWEEGMDLLKNSVSYEKLILDRATQIEKRKELKNSLTNNFRYITTFKIFAERFPELAKYLPNVTEVSKGTQLVTSALMGSLKASGFKTKGVVDEKA